MKKYAGNWMMNGRQANVPRSGWEASLILEANGMMTWKEVKGMNVGAQRNGTWELDGTVFRMRYRAPGVGLVEWTAQNPGTKNMSGSYRTPDVDPDGVGWGGDWNASKV